VKRTRQWAWVGLGIALVLPAAASGQTRNDWETSRLHATRAQLEEKLRLYEQGANTEGYSEHVRRPARQEAELIRQRLAEGDFQVGDQINMTVTGMAQLSGTFTVSEGLVLLLPDIGSLSVAGLLRSELQQGLRDQLSKYIRDPEVFAKSNIRLSVWGAVGAPGYIVVSSDALLVDVLTQAGQPTPVAEQDKIEIKRNGDVIWEDEPLEEAIVQGRTIDQMNLRAGDRIEVPGTTRSSSLLGDALRNLRYILPLAFLIQRIF
jgi:protein involved in polysaccharide export with SLBB domain